MSEELLKLFLEEDCDLHAQSILLAAIRAKKGTDGIQDFTFNRFNVRLDFANGEAVLDDDLNPDYGEHRLPLDNFAALIAGIRRT